MSPERQIEELLTTHNLHLHPLNNWLYGQPDPEQELVDSIEKLRRGKSE